MVVLSDEALKERAAADVIDTAVRHSREQERNYPFGARTSS